MNNLIIDLSNTFFRSLYRINGYNKGGYSFDNQFELDQLMRKVSTDISYIIRQANPSRIIFALDSKSWRKEISIDENEGYKANREKSTNVNWYNVFKIMKEFGEILDSNGFIVSQINNAEADDIIALWRDELLFNQNQHITIVSADEDIRQLVGFFPYDIKKMAFCVVYNPDKRKGSNKLFIPKYFNEWLNTQEEGDIFNRAIDVDKEDFIRLKKNGNVEFEEIDGNYVALKKIFCGDDGDNVPAIFTWLNNNKETRITDTKFKKIVENTNISDYIDVIDKKNSIKEELIKISGVTKLPFDITDRLERQMKLVVLSNMFFPEQIVKDFQEQLANNIKKPNIHPQSYNMNTLLEGTKYVNSKKGNESSIFKEIDTIKSKKLF
jgi:hypothetical protein